MNALVEDAHYEVARDQPTQRGRQPQLRGRMRRRQKEHKRIAIRVARKEFGGGGTAPGRSCRSPNPGIR